MINGKRYHRAVPEASEKKQAAKAEAVFKTALLQGRLKEVERRKYIDLKELISEYLQYSKTNKISYSNDEIYCNHFLNFIGNKDINEITPQHIEKYKNHRQKESIIVVKKDKDGNETKITKYIQNSTINRELNSISKMFSIAVENDWLDENPCFKVKKLRVENKQERFLTKEEETRLFDACILDKAYLRPIIICALHTGMRKAEILNLKWSCVDFTHKYIDVLKTKSGKARKIPISNTLFQELENMPRTSEYVFTNLATKKPYYDLKKPFERLCDKADINDLRFHDLRHTAATRMVSAGIDLVVVQELLGHHDIKTTMRYSHPVPERKLDAINALDI